MLQRRPWHKSTGSEKWNDANAVAYIVIFTILVRCIRALHWHLQPWRLSVRWPECHGMASIGVRNRQFPAPSEKLKQLCKLDTVSDYTFLLFGVDTPPQPVAFFVLFCLVVCFCCCFFTIWRRYCDSHCDRHCDRCACSSAPSPLAEIQAIVLMTPMTISLYGFVSCLSCLDVWSLSTSPTHRADRTINLVYWVKSCCQ